MLLFYILFFYATMHAMEQKIKDIPKELGEPKIAWQISRKQEQNVVESSRIYSFCMEEKICSVAKSLTRDGETFIAELMPGVSSRSLKILRFVEAKKEEKKYCTQLVVREPHVYNFPSKHYDYYTKYFALVGSQYIFELLQKKFCEQNNLKKP